MTNDAVTVPEVTPGRYAAPRVTVVPVTETIDSEPIKGRRWAGHYQHLLLDTGTGELNFHESTEHLEAWDPAWTAINDVPAATWKRWHPGTAFVGRGPHMWFEPVPALLSWTIDSGTEVLPYLDADAANALLEELAPTAQALLDGLFEVGGDLDWSADSARAGRNLGRLVSRHRQAAGDPGVDGDLVDFAEIVARCPQVYKPELLGYGRSRLAQACETTTRLLGSNEHWNPEIKKHFGVPAHDGTCVLLEVLGVRAWYRTAILGGDPRPAREFEDWDAEHGRLAAATLTSASTDADLEAWAAAETGHAGQHGVRLLGALEAARAHRAQLREKDWDRLAVVGAEVARLERELSEARDARLELVTRAIGWGRGDAAIGDRARMTRQAVYKIRNNQESQES